ncbi:MAG: T9SS type A sorting domain-containing protein [Bacteroidia bacterium]
MKKQLLILVILASMQNAVAQPLFQNIYGSNNPTEVHFASSPDAYYLVHDAGFPSLITELAKTDLNGNVIWTKTINYSVSSSDVYRIKYDSNSLLLTGATYNAGYRNYFAKLDTAGNVLWTNEINYGDINDNTRIHPLSSGYLTVGHRDCVCGASSYTFDITLSRFDATGNLLWAKAYGNNSYEFLANASIITPNGDLITAGNYGLRVPNDYDPMLARFDASGNLLWMKTFEDTTGFFTYFQPTDIGATPDGNYVMTGFSVNTNFNFDAQVIKFDDNGNIIWAKRPYQIGWEEYGRSIIVDSQDNIVVAGPYYLSSDYGDFFMKLDSAGNLLGTTKIKNTSNNLFHNVYSSHGEDLVERPGNGYVYSTYFYQTVYKHCLLTTDYIGTTGCPSLGGTYPFSIQNVTWTPTTFTNLPSAQTNLTGTMVAYTDSSLTANVVDICSLVGVNEINSINDEINIYPNPVNSELNIQSRELISEIKIYDVVGKEFFKSQLQTKSNDFKLQTSNYTTGVYFIEIISGDKKEIIKFLKVD